VRFVFGYNAWASMVERAGAVPDELYHELAARAERAIKTRPRAKPANVKDAIVRARGYKVLRQKGEDVVSFSYGPAKCRRDYRVVVLRKDLSVERGKLVLFHEHRWLFYITAPRGALTYPPLSRDGLEMISLGRMAYLDSQD
jgi:hypothetical protein